MENITIQDLCDAILIAYKKGYDDHRLETSYVMRDKNNYKDISEKQAEEISQLKACIAANHKAIDEIMKMKTTI